MIQSPLTQAPAIQSVFGGPGPLSGASADASAGRVAPSEHQQTDAQADAGAYRQPTGDTSGRLVDVRA